MPFIVVSYPILTNQKEKAVRTIMIEFAIGQIVSLKTDPDSEPHIVTAWVISENGVTYDIAIGAEVSNHYSIELELVEYIE